MTDNKSLNKRYIYNKLLPLLLMLLFFSGFMGYRGIDTFNIKYIFLSACFAAYFVYCRIRSHQNNHLSVYDIGVILLILIIYLSFIPGLIWGGQSVYYSFRGAFGLLYVPIFLYFFFKGKQYTENDIIRCLSCLFVVYIIIYIYSYIIFPDIKFSQNYNTLDKIEDDFESRGTLRLMIPFEDLIALGLFYFINNPLKNKNNNIVVIVILIVLTLLRGTRSVMFATAVIAILLLLKKSHIRITKNVIIRYIIEFCAIGIGLFLVYKVMGLDSLFNSYREISAKDLDSGGDYIRWVMALYYLTQYNSSIGEFIFGHGIPVSGNYQKDVFENADFGFYPDDIGYVEIFLNFGIIGLVVLGFIFFSLVKKKVSPHNYYAKYYLYYIFLITFLGRYILTNMILFVSMLYIVDISVCREKNQRKSENSNNIPIVDTSR